MSRRDLGTSIRRRGKTVDKPAMEQMLRRERAMRKRRRKQKSISLAAAVSKNVIALATSLHGIGPLIQDGTLRKRVADMEPAWHPPRGFSLVPIEMSNFSMELLLHQIEDNAGDSEQVDTAERLLMENREVVLQLHGGGYIGKIRNAYRDFAVLYAKMPGKRAVLSVDYRVAPENPYPAALEDACAAYEWLLEMGCASDKIIVVGDSAGGGLALALCLYLKDKKKPLPKKLVLMSPYISPLYGDYEGLPPMLFQVGGAEMLLSDSVRAAKKAKAAGCEVHLTVYDEMFHVFQLGMKMMKESRNAWKEIEEFLNC